MTSSIFSFEINNVCFAKFEGCPVIRYFLCIPASAVDAASNPNGIKTPSVKSLSIFPIQGKPVLSNGPRCLLRNPPNCIIFI